MKHFKKNRPLCLAVKLRTDSYLDVACPRHRITPSAHGQPQQNSLCSSYKQFFREAKPDPDIMKQLWLSGIAPTAIMKILATRPEDGQKGSSGSFYNNERQRELQDTGMDALNGKNQSGQPKVIVRAGKKRGT